MRPHRAWARGQVVALFAASAAAQGPAATPGSVDSSSCTGLANGQNCAKDGSSNFNSWTGSYNQATGQFSGRLTTNLCSGNRYGWCPKCNNGAGMEITHQHTASCTEQTFPAAGYGTTPKAAPLRGRVGLSVTGVSIYGPMEAGFGSGNQPNPCTNGQTGVCSGGLDVPMCEAKIEHECGAANVDYGLMLDTCGGHAMPYHYHQDLACDYDSTQAGHSPLIGIALDGYGIYGLMEQTGTRPANLDPCNGHTAAVPAKTTGSITTTASTVYHYHVTSTPPYTIGCFGPISAISQCTSLYTTCGQGFELIPTAAVPTGVCYDLDCPCYDTQGKNAPLSSCVATGAPSPPGGVVVTPPPTFSPSFFPTFATAPPTLARAPTQSPSRFPTLDRGITPPPTQLTFQTLFPTNSGATLPPTFGTLPPTLASGGATCATGRVQRIRIKLMKTLTTFSGSAFRAAVISAVTSTPLVSPYVCIDSVCPERACNGGDCPAAMTARVAAGCETGAQQTGRHASGLQASDPVFVDFDVYTGTNSNPEQALAVQDLQNDVRSCQQGLACRLSSQSPSTGYTPALVYSAATPAPPSGGDDDSMPVWLIVVLIVICVLVVCIAIVVIFILCCKEKDRDAYREGNNRGVGGKDVSPSSYRDEGWGNGNNEMAQQGSPRAGQPVPYSGGAPASRGLQTPEHPDSQRGPVGSPPANWHLPAGTRVEALFGDNLYYEATIWNQAPDGSYGVQWYDGTFSDGVSPEHVNVLQ